MKNERDKETSRLALRKYLVFFLFSLVLTGLVNVRLPQHRGKYQTGDIADETVRSPSDYKVPGTDVTLKKGEVIVREGQRISRDDLQKLSAVRDMERRRGPLTGQAIYLFLIFFSLIAITFEFADKNIKKFKLSEKDLVFSAALTVFTVFLIKAFLAPLQPVRSRIIPRCSSTSSLSFFSASSCA